MSRKFSKIGAMGFARYVALDGLRQPCDELKN
jgi:hypothetical protein